MKKLIKVYSDNYDGQLMTRAAYNELRLQMSTGDFHTHKAIVVEVLELGDMVELENEPSESEA